MVKARTRTKAKRAKTALKGVNRAANNSPKHRRAFEQLLGDAILGVEKK